jgi:hypothetical protein
MRLPAALCAKVSPSTPLREAVWSTAAAACLRSHSICTETECAVQFSGPCGCVQDGSLWASLGRGSLTPFLVLELNHATRLILARLVTWFKPGLLNP